jgi:hypothetical protein
MVGLLAVGGLVLGGCADGDVIVPPTGGPTRPTTDAGTILVPDSGSAEDAATGPDATTTDSGTPPIEPTEPLPRPVDSDRTADDPNMDLRFKLAQTGAGFDVRAELTDWEQLERVASDLGRSGYVPTVVSSPAPDEVRVVGHRAFGSDRRYEARVRYVPSADLEAEARIWGRHGYLITAAFPEASGWVVFGYRLVSLEQPMRTVVAKVRAEDASELVADWADRGFVVTAAFGEAEALTLVGHELFGSERRWDGTVMKTGTSDLERTIGELAQEGYLVTAAHHDAGSTTLVAFREHGRWAPLEAAAAKQVESEDVASLAVDWQEQRSVTSVTSATGPSGDVLIGYKL